jgi:4-hydroxybenzoate polyprenyltransferase
MSRLRGWIQAAHPFPLTAVLVVTALVGVAASEGEVNPGRLGLALLAMLSSQLCIGWTNDYRDRLTDAAFQPGKPVPSGLVPPAQLRVAAITAGVTTVAVGLTLPVEAFGLLVVGTAAGLAYNFGVKDTPLSWLPYAVAFAVLPPYVWSALDVFRDEYLWLYLVAAPLAPGVHLANVLPDLEADAAAGRHSIAVLLGRRASVLVIAGCFLAPVGLVAVTLLWLTYDIGLLAGVSGAYGLLVGVALMAYGLPSERDGAVLAFRCLVVAAVAFTAGWLAAVR